MQACKLQKCTGIFVWKCKLTSSRKKFKCSICQFLSLSGDWEMIEKMFDDKQKRVTKITLSEAISCGISVKPTREHNEKSIQLHACKLSKFQNSSFSRNRGLQEKKIYYNNNNDKSTFFHCARVEKNFFSYLQLESSFFLKQNNN